MSTVLPALSALAAGGVRALAGLLVIRQFLAAPRPGKAALGAAAGGAAAIAAIAAAAGAAGSLPVLLETLWLTFCARRFLRTDLRMTLFFAIFYEIAAAFWQFLFAAWLGVAFHAPAFLDLTAPQGQCAFWAPHALLLLLALRLLRQTEASPQTAFRTASAVITAGFLAVVTLSAQPWLPVGSDVLSMWTTLSLVLIAAALVYSLNRQYQTEKELAQLKTEQAQLLERDYTALSRAYALNARLFHDAHNHIGALRQLLAHGKTGEAVRYLDELQAPVREMADAVWTGDEAADYLINSKAAAAGADGIRFEARVEFPRHTDLHSADLCAILGNLLDNALEAARRVPETQERFARLTIRRINQMLVIKVENSFAEAPVARDGVLQTTKTGGGLHGWGLKSARTAAEKYDGTLQTSCAGHTFRAVATLSFQGVPPLT